MNAKIEGHIEDIRYLVHLWERFESPGIEGEILIKEPITSMSIVTAGMCHTLEVVRKLK